MSLFESNESGLIRIEKIEETILNCFSILLWGLSLESHIYRRLIKRDSLK